MLNEKGDLMQLVFIITLFVCNVRIYQESSCLQTRETSPETESASTLALNFPDSKTAGNTFLLLKPLSLSNCIAAQGD